jgi:hypothetical protein
MTCVRHASRSRFASESLRVEQGASIVAEALGVRSPDRCQEFAQLGETENVVDRTESIWRTCGIDRAEAANLARKTFDPKYAVKRSCPCGGEVSKCAEKPVAQIGQIVRSSSELDAPEIEELLEPVRETWTRFDLFDRVENTARVRRAVVRRLHDSQ